MIVPSDCRRCKRLVRYRHQLIEEFPDYHNAPVEPWGEADAPVLIVGLAPGKHGANASGYPFTGDASGELLFQVLYHCGFSSRSSSGHGEPGFRLLNCRITNAVKCLPPQNRPVATEIANCSRYLRTELEQRGHPGIVIALGRIAHQAVIRALDLRQKDFPFAHAAEHCLDENRIMLDSYHCSRYNIQTRRLTPSMFERVFRRASDLLKRHE